MRGVYVLWGLCVGCMWGVYEGGSVYGSTVCMVLGDRKRQDKAAQLPVVVCID